MQHLDHGQTRCGDSIAVAPLAYAVHGFRQHTPSPEIPVCKYHGKRFSISSMKIPRTSTLIGIDCVRSCVGLSRQADKCPSPAFGASSPFSLTTTLKHRTIRNGNPEESWAEAPELMCSNRDSARTLRQEPDMPSANRLSVKTPSFSLSPS